MMQSDTEPKFCKDCKHYGASGSVGIFGVGMGWPDLCWHPKNMSERELVRGRRHPLADPPDLRKPEGACGEAGAMFEAKPPEPPESKLKPESYQIERYQIEQLERSRTLGFWDWLFCR